MMRACLGGVGVLLAFRACCLGCTLVEMRPFHASVSTQNLKAFGNHSNTIFKKYRVTFAVGSIG